MTIFQHRNAATTTIFARNLLLDQDNAVARSDITDFPSRIESDACTVKMASLELDVVFVV